MAVSEEKRGERSCHEAKKGECFQKEEAKKDESISVNGLDNVKVVTIPREVEVILGILNSQWEVAG